MRTFVIALAVAIAASLAGCKKQAPEGPVLSPTFDERQSCGGDDDCAVVEIECCDACNGGTAVGVHKDHAADVRKEYVAADRCEGTACTLMACPTPVAVCEAGRCGVKIGGNVSFPELPPPPTP
jgi:hypothetical protein